MALTSEANNTGSVVQCPAAPHHVNFLLAVPALSSGGQPLGLASVQVLPPKPPPLSTSPGPAAASPAAGGMALGHAQGPDVPAVRPRQAGLPKHTLTEECHREWNTAARPCCPLNTRETSVTGSGTQRPAPADRRPATCRSAWQRASTLRAHSGARHSLSTWPIP